jgi:DNA-directed RNA polymerase
MQDADRIARQLAMELAMDQEGQSRLQSRTRQAEARAYASATIYGKKALEAHLGGVAELIGQRLGRISNGIAGQDYRLIAERIGSADAKVLALLAMKTCLDTLGMAGGQVTKMTGKPLMTYTNLTGAIGRAVQTELRLQHYKSQDPELFRAVTRGFHASTGTRQKATVYKLRFNREGIEWQTWSPTISTRIGAWLLDCLQRRTGWISTDLTGTGYKNRVLMVRFSKEFMHLKERIMERAMELASCTWPMLCEPVDWSNDHPGGYLTASERKFKMVRTHTGSTLRQGDLPIQMLNNLQKQAYRINGKVFEVAEYCFENFITVGQFKREERREPPTPPAEGASEEAIKEYKLARRKLEDVNAQLERNNWRTMECIYVARKFVDVDRFWICWSFDYRGRIYPLNTCLTPQGTDFDKSLFYFADEGEVNEYWLAFQVATTFGLDKATMQERVEWARANTELISRIACNPLDTISEWRQAEEPWCFLASCFEYYECCIAKTKQTSGLPVGVDATCSGLQHLSAMTLDARAAALVNVTPTPIPADGYKTVAEQAKKHLDTNYHEWITRKVTKRTVMCTPYGVTRHSARGYIREALRDAGCTLNDPGDLSTITKAIYDQAMPEVFDGPVRVMNWIQESAARITREGAEHITWTTPSGFVVRQEANKPEVERIKTQLMGQGAIKSSVYKGPGPVDVDKHKSCTAPNLVHSADASLLHFTFSEWDKPFTVIHDCALGRSCDMDEMGRMIRLHFAEMYKGNVLQDWANQVGATLPPDLIKGDLDIDLVNASTYFFC